MNENAAPSPGHPRRVAKRFLVIFLAAVALLAGVAIVHYYVVMRAEWVKREASELFNLDLGKATIADELKNIVSDLMFLARHNEMFELRGMFEVGDPKLRHILSHQFLIFIAQKVKYDQIRLLDQSGMEIIRVNYNNGNPTIVADDQLQNKAQRPYFTITWALARGESYIFPLDLNIEHGQIEKPAKQIIRFGAPVFDPSGRKNGIVLLNYLGEKLIRDFKVAAANISDHIVLLNSDGYWLGNPKPDDEWGFMHNNDHVFAKTHDDAWQRIQADDSGQFYNQEGMFTFTTIYPLLHATGNRRSTGQDGSPVTDKGYYWKAVSHVPSGLLTNTPYYFFRQNLLLYSTMLALLAIASLLFARASVGQMQAAKQVKLEQRFRSSLEEKVEERTRELKDTLAEKDRVVQQLIQAEKMAAIGTMAAGIGHEINNPLYAILGMAEAIRDEKDVSRFHGYGRDIVTHSKRIAEIVRNLSGYVHPVEEHALEAVDVNEKLSEAVSMVRRSLLNDYVEIKENLMPVPGIKAKPEEVQQAFFNIIRNGVQAIRGKGTLEITSRQEDDRVSIRIRDTGVGIPEEHLGKILDPFFTTKSPDEGEGLGLFVVQQIVNKYAGTISFESQKGKGTVCTVEFPVGEKIERSDRNEAEDPSRR